ncbi:protein FAM98A-like [Lingula anatina]|uniref:Protein FAM98A-like n=1 Tax=Lingula anatina TaxID=7574 RepID=A0A1S3HQE4_LINAN|nr:protein FAM98A-like [Lingula anatina]|eukprot:XP_013387259.1 protein FAM98A-like [Lingula anatina]
MENDVLDSLDDLGYEGPLLDENGLRQAIEGGPQSAEYTQLVEWLTKEIGGFCKLDDVVNAIKGQDDVEHFMLELSGFLREYGCPHKELSEGPLSQRLATKENRLLLLDFLCTELQAVRMIAVNKPSLLSSSNSTSPMEVENEAESDSARHLKSMLIALGFPKPPPNITPFQLFSKVEQKVRELIGKVSPSHMGKPLLKAKLTEKQWQSIQSISEALQQEYGLRREMLLTRLDVTIQSFKWSDRAKSKENEVAAAYQPLRKHLSARKELGIAEILAARDDLISIQKTSSGDARMKCAINKIIMGSVPDRGGRAWELQPPPPDMPFFQKRQEAPRGQRPQTAGGRGGRGGRVQGGWSGDRPQSGGNWGRGGGGYRGGRGGRGRGGY